jgi:hypothetical protein
MKKHSAIPEPPTEYLTLVLQAVETTPKDTEVTGVTLRISGWMDKPDPEHEIGDSIRQVQVDLQTKDGVVLLSGHLKEDSFWALRRFVGCLEGSI